ncbi:MAG: type IV pili methyl-accepting chemotaxis transducer N-terminal domain-containing protein [Rhizobacter sp.]|nr:type IV pili methyl-accepting chemotaxis transducer N-terminal domain-containing protein [Chlorobiales bacterium]
MLALLLLLLLISAVLGYINFSAVAAEERQLLVMSRQRTLLQKMVKEAVLATQDNLSTESRLRLSQTAEEFDKILEGFSEGSLENNIRRIYLNADLRTGVPVIDSEAQDDFEQLTAAWNLFYDDLEIIIAAEEIDSDVSAALEAVLAADGGLQEQLDRLIRTMQLDADEHYRTRISVQTGVLLTVASLILILLWQLLNAQIFVPFEQVQKLAATAYGVPFSEHDTVRRFEERLRAAAISKSLTAPLPAVPPKTMQPDLPETDTAKEAIPFSPPPSAEQPIELPDAVRL